MLSRKAILISGCDSGFGNTLDIDENKVVPNPTLSIKEGALVPFFMPSALRKGMHL